MGCHIRPAGSTPSAYVKKLDEWLGAIIGKENLASLLVVVASGGVAALGASASWGTCNDDDLKGPGPADVNIGGGGNGQPRKRPGRRRHDRQHEVDRLEAEAGEAKAKCKALLREQAQLMAQERALKKAIAGSMLQIHLLEWQIDAPLEHLFALHCGCGGCPSARTCSASRCSAGGASCNPSGIEAGVPQGGGLQLQDSVCQLGQERGQQQQQQPPWEHLQMQDLDVPMSVDWHQQHYRQQQSHEYMLPLQHQQPQSNVLRQQQQQQQQQQLRPDHEQSSGLQRVNSGLEPWHPLPVHHGELHWQQQLIEEQRQFMQSPLGCWGARETRGLGKLQPAPPTLIDGVRFLYKNMMAYITKMLKNGASHGSVYRDHAALMLAQDLHGCIRQLFLMHPALRPQLLCINLLTGEEQLPPPRCWGEVVRAIGAVQHLRGDEGARMELLAVAELHERSMSQLQAKQGDLQRQLALILLDSPPGGTARLDFAGIKSRDRMLDKLEMCVFAQHSLETAIFSELHHLLPPEMMVHCLVASSPWWPDTAAMMQVIAEELAA